MIKLASPKAGQVYTEVFLTPDNSQDFAAQLSYCSLPRRLMVMLYDAVILLGLLMVASAIALPFGAAEKLAFRDFWFTVWLLVVCFIYLGGCWHSAGMTVGMRAWRVKVTDADGGKPGWLRCLLRFLVGFVSIGVAGLGFIWALFDHKRRCWHDLASHTVLIRNHDLIKKRSK